MRGATGLLAAAVVVAACGTSSSSPTTTEFAPAPVTTVAATTTSQAHPDKDASGGSRLSHASIPFDQIEAELGSFTWMIVEGNDETLPEVWGTNAGLTVEIDDLGNYVSWDWWWWAEEGQDEWRVWQSTDALTWTFEYVGSNPLPDRFRDRTPVVELPDGGWGLFWGLNTHAFRTDPPTALISSDGAIWVAVEPTFVTDDFESAIVWERDGLLEAEVYLRSPTGFERWTSRDGVQWSPRFSHPAGSVYATAFGLVAIDADRVYVSIDDGASWARAPVPPRFRRLQDSGGLSVQVGAFDDFVFIRVDLDDGTRLFLIGRFQNDN